MIEVHTSRRDQLATIAAALGRLDHGDAHVDGATRRVTVAIDDPGRGLVAALRALDVSGVEIEDIALRQPTLDEVFLALTGSPATDDERSRAEPVEAAAA